MILNEQQIKDYLIEEMTYWLREHYRCLETGVGYEEAFLAKVNFSSVYEKLFGEEEYKKVYLKIYYEINNDFK